MMDDMIGRVDDMTFAWMIAHHDLTIVFVVLFTVIVQMGGITFAYWYDNWRISV